jgi:NTE family protein
MTTVRNMVFKGGGVRGIAYLGALKYCFERDWVRHVKRVAGTSAGAITAVILALNLDDFQELKTIADSLDYRRVPSDGDESDAPRQGSESNRLAARLQSLGFVKNIQCTSRLIQEKGWYSSEYFYEWLRAIIKSRFSIAKDAYTFRDFADSSIHKEGKTFLDLYVTGTDISNRRSRIFSLQTTPDLEVALAVRMSMSIPLFFEAVPYRYPGTEDEQLYVDGGIMWNYPIGLFDDPKYGRKFSEGVNQETLGFFVYVSPEKETHRPIKGLVDHIGALFETLLFAQEKLVFQGESAKGRTIFIDDMGVEQTEFDIVTGDPTYTKLFDSGYRAALDFARDKMNESSLFKRLQRRLGWN